MKSFYKYCTLLTMSFICTNSYAGFKSDTTQMKTISVKEALQKDDKAVVVLEGYILSEIRHEKYEFSDGKDTICVEIDDYDNGKRVMPEKEFDKNQKIRIKGEIDKDFKPFGDKCNKIKIDVKSVDLIDKS